MERKNAKRLAALLAAAAVFAALYWFVAPLLSWDYLVSQEEGLRQYQRDHLWLTFGAGFLLYATVTAFPLPGASLLTLVYGWYFGLWPGVVLVSFASTAGATLAFLMSRYFLRDAVRQRFGKQFDAMESALKTEGPFYLFMLRLVPLAPFFAINSIMGLMPLTVFTYWWISQLGMLPATVIFVFAGSSVPDLATLAEKGAAGILSPSLLVALGLLGVFPIVIKKAAGWWGKRRKGSDGSVGTTKEGNHEEHEGHEERTGNHEGDEGDEG